MGSYTSAHGLVGGWRHGPAPPAGALHGSVMRLFSRTLRNLLPVAPVIDAMRRISFLALMVLLVLRGLLGTAMAAGMVPALPAGGAVLQATVAQHWHASHSLGDSHAESLEFAAHAEHSMGTQNMDTHAPCSDPASSPCGASPHTHSPLCPACEICHSALQVPSPLSTPLRCAASEVRPGATAPFASVQPALAIKPPIA